MKRSPNEKSRKVVGGAGGAWTRMAKGTTSGCQRGWSGWGGVRVALRRGGHEKKKNKRSNGT